MEFLLAAAPFVVIGVCVAILCASRGKRKAADSYMLPGMSVGMCLGLSVTAALDLDMGLGVSLGMLAGMTAGLFIKKDPEE